MLPRDEISKGLARNHPALVAFITAGYPEKARFLEHVAQISEAVDAIEIGVPFTDPMADGVTIQRSSEQAIAQGVTLRWILDTLAERPASNATPILLMSYLNPLLAYGFDRLAADAVRARVSGFMVPDLPYEECAPLHAALTQHGLALVQFITPATPTDRISQLSQASEGFVYAVTRTGITGGAVELPTDIAAYLASVKQAADIPVCAGFGVRSAEQVTQIAAHADGVIVGSALVEVLERGDDPRVFLRGLRSSS